MPLFTRAGLHGRVAKQVENVRAGMADAGVKLKDRSYSAIHTWLDAHAGETGHDGRKLVATLHKNSISAFVRGDKGARTKAAADSLRFWIYAHESY